MGQNLCEYTESGKGTFAPCLVMAPLGLKMKRAGSESRPSFLSSRLTLPEDSDGAGSKLRAFCWGVTLLCAHSAGESLCCVWDPASCSCQALSHRTAGVLCLPACHVNILCGLLACFKKGLNGFATLAVGLEQLPELGGEASETPPE